jgi:hypothetical protein
MQSLKSVIRKRVVEPLQIEGDVDPPEWRQIFEEKQIRENEGHCGDDFAGGQESMLLQNQDPPDYPDCATETSRISTDSPYRCSGDVSS